MEWSRDHAPLAKRMMPRTLEEYAGQPHLVGPGKPVRAMADSGILHSMIFYGPPATGKTSLAEILAGVMGCRFISTNALTLDTEEIRKVIREARENSASGRRTVVFVDEIHRLIKPKQDAFLSALENGELVLIGATTENPFFTMVPAFRSRVFIYEFKPHTEKDLERMLDRALTEDRVLKALDIRFEDGGREKLIRLTGDARRLFNTLEMTVLTAGLGSGVVITPDAIQAVLQSTDTNYSQADAHYDVISAFIKSIRGSDPDAAIHYLAEMISGGEDPLFIARRLIILASEDIGLAYPEALPAAVACYQAIENIGMPEGQLVLASTTLLLAGVPKSNSATAAIGKAMADIAAGRRLAVPPHLRDSHYSGAGELGRGIGYKYPHDYPSHYVRQDYTAEAVSYYQPGTLGFEKKITDWLARLRGEKA